MSTIQHTYLRYECADSFGIVFSSGSSKAPSSNATIKFLGETTTAATSAATLPQNSRDRGDANPPYAPSTLLAAAAGGCVTLYNTRTSLPVWRFYHHQELAGGAGTGRAWNSDEVVCLDTVTIATTDTRQRPTFLFKVATGWVDGAVRVWTVAERELRERGQRTLVTSLLHSGDHDGPADESLEPPLVLNGHNQSPVGTLAFDPRDASRLASAGSDGSVVLWDVVAETGLFRLIGHTGGVTQVIFLELTGLDGLVTSSLDGLLKVWDLGGQCCIQTIASHRGEVWGAACSRLWRNHSGQADDEHPRHRMITGGSEGRILVWSLQIPKRLGPTLVSDSEDSSAQPIDDVCGFMGVLSPPPNVSVSTEKIKCIKFHPNGKFFGVLYGNAKHVDVYIVRNVQDSLKRRQRRLKRREEKEKKKQKEIHDSKEKKRGMLDDPVLSDEENDDRQPEERLLDPKKIRASDEFEYLSTIRANHKIKSFSFSLNKEKKELVRVVCALTTNAFETYSITQTAGTEKGSTAVTSNKVVSMDISGHPTGIRAIGLSSDDALACTVSKNATKIWNVESRTCIQSLAPGTLSSSKQSAAYGLCVTFLPGNSHVVVGTREGHLLIVDISSGAVVFCEEDAHETAVWSIDVHRPSSVDGSIVVVTGSADKAVKFWDVESSGDDDDGSEADHPVLVHTRTLQMTDDVVAVKFSHALDPSKRLVCVATLDCTVKVFFEDTLKLFLSLYGHKLPVLAVDCSDDDVLLASASADKTVKIWGLDFGDTHRTLHGHEDSITDIRFVRRTHNFFTACKDGTVRYWDGDRFEQILTLPGHTAEVQGLAISRTGAFVLSCGMDRQVRVWERTKDIVFLEEERERELEQVFDRVGNRDEKNTANILDEKGAESGNEEDDALDESQPQSEAAVKRSVLSISAGDRLMEGLERADQELKAISLFRSQAKDSKKRQPDPMLMGMEPSHYILWILRSIKSAELEQSLLVLSLAHVERLIYYCLILLKQGRGVELCSRVAVFVVKVHQWHILTNQSLAVPLRELRLQMRSRLSESRDALGYNIAAMKIIGKMAREQKATFIDDDLPVTNVWAGLGLGSDVAAALDGRPNKR